MVCGGSSKSCIIWFGRAFKVDRIRIALSAVERRFSFQLASLVLKLSNISWRSYFSGVAPLIGNPKYFLNLTSSLIMRKDWAKDLLAGKVLLEKNILDFARLTFWPDIELKWSRMLDMVEHVVALISTWRIISSINKRWDIRGLCGEIVIDYQRKWSTTVLIQRDSLSIHKIKMCSERGLPWQIPLFGEKKVVGCHW